MLKQRFNDLSSGDSSDDGEKIVLDKATFRALASDTRVEILKELDKRRKTLTELSDSVGLSVATIKEHMESLSKSSLVLVKDEGRKWKYYELTEKGKAVLYPERRKIWVMIVALLFTIVLSTYMSFYDVGYLGGQENDFDRGSTSIAGMPLRDIDDRTREISDVTVEETESQTDAGDVPPDEDLDSPSDMGIMQDDSGAETMAQADVDSDNEKESFTDTIFSMPIFRYVSHLVAVIISAYITILGVRHVRKRSRNKRSKA